LLICHRQALPKLAAFQHECTEDNIRLLDAAREWGTLAKANAVPEIKEAAGGGLCLLRCTSIGWLQIKNGGRRKTGNDKKRSRVRRKK
jgi:hypothetical protein